MVQSILRRDQVENVTGLSRSGIYRKIADGSFPKPIRISLNSVGWLEGEILAWQRARIAERDGVPSNKEAA